MSLVLSVADVARVSSCEWKLLALTHSQLAAMHDMAAYLAELSRLHGRTVASRLRSLHGNGAVITDEYLSCSHYEGVVPCYVRGAHGLQLYVPKFSSHVRKDVRVEAGGLAWLMRERYPGTLALTVIVDLASGKTQRFATATVIDQFLGVKQRIDALLEAPREMDVHTWRSCERVCGGCRACQAAIAAFDDVLAIPGVGPTLRADLARTGIFTRTQLAQAAPAGVPAGVIRKARAQVEQAALTRGPYGQRIVVAVNSQQQALAAVPPAAPGDVYLDCENDSMWGWTSGDHTGLVYLIGVLTTSGTGPAPQPAWEHPARVAATAGSLARAHAGHYVPHWAHNRSAERVLIDSVLTWLEQRIRRYPQMHIYHYSQQDLLILARLVRRHGLAPQRLTALTAHFVDLFTPVTRALTTGAPSNSLKDIEPLYMGPWRRGDVDNAAASLVLYNRASRTGSSPNPQVLEQLACYNEYDCVSTLQLHRWLLAQQHVSQWD